MSVSDQVSSLLACDSVSEGIVRAAISRELPHMVSRKQSAECDNCRVRCRGTESDGWERFASEQLTEQTGK